jgi:integrase
VPLAEDPGTVPATSRAANHPAPWRRHAAEAPGETNHQLAYGSFSNWATARTIGHAHRVLHRGLARVVSLEVVSRNVAHAAPPPKVEAAEIAILSAAEIADVLSKLDGHPLHPIVALALGTGMRRGELRGLAWGSFNLDAATVKVERSLEETATGLRLKPPKTRHGRRTISLPTGVVEIIRVHRRRQAEQRLLLGLGRLGADDYVFTLGDGSPYPPDKLSRDWGNVVRDRKLPRVMFHALRHSHASALIAAGLDAGNRQSAARSRLSGDDLDCLCSQIREQGQSSRRGDRSGDGYGCQITGLKGLGCQSGANASLCSLAVPKEPVVTHCLRSVGEVPERSNGAVSKTVVPLAGDRGFESLPLRHSPFLAVSTYLTTPRHSRD